jgi:hypothetical protein
MAMRFSKSAIARTYHASLQNALDSNKNLTEAKINEQQY